MTNITQYSSIAAVLISALLIACAPSAQTQSLAGSSNESAKADTTKEYQKAPDFTLNTMQGNSFTLSDYKGKVVVINIWATWCAPCRKEIPEFITMQRNLRDQDVLFVGVSIDEKGWDAVRPYAQKMDINYPVVVDDGSVSEGYGPFRLIPTSYIINKRGQVEYVVPGMITEEKLKPILEKLAAR